MLGTVNQTFVQNGQIQGGDLGYLDHVGDIGMLRPFIESRPDPKFDRYRGRPCVEVTTGYRQVFNEAGVMEQQPIKKLFLQKTLQEIGRNSPVFNATTLRKDQWVSLDAEVLREARLPMRAHQDIQGINTYAVNGMGKTILEYEAINDFGEAIVDMDGITPGRGDAPQFIRQGLPLPITHMDFWYTSRDMAISRNGGMGFDTITGEVAGRRVGESLERQTIGVETGISYGGTGAGSGGAAYPQTSKVYGMLNYPYRVTKVNLYKPTGVGRAGTGWVPNDTVLDILGMLDTMALQKFTGPFMMYVSNDWDQYLDRDYNLVAGSNPNQTLRERLKKIERIKDIRRLDFLAASTTFSTTVEQITSTNPWTIILLQETKDVARMVSGLPLTTVQWEEKGGMKLLFKVMTISVPHFRSTFAGNCGLMHANASSGV